MMKHLFCRQSLKTAMVAAVLVLTCLCSGCADVVKLTEQGGNLYDAKNNITYHSASICYEASKIASEPYAACKKPKLELYEVIGQPTDCYIAEPYEGIGGLWYADGVTLPSLTEFHADMLYVCVEEVLTIGLTAIDDKTVIDSVIDAFILGTPCTIVNAGTSYKLKFASDEYEGIFYNLLYVEGDDGKNYIYDRSTKTCVEVGDVLTASMPRTTGGGIGEDTTAA